MPDTYRYDVFVSYVGADQAWVQGELLPRLAAAGLRYALSDLAAATAPARVERAENRIRESRRLIAVLSPDYLADAMAKFENMLAQTLDLQEMTLRVIPVLIAPIALHHLPIRLAMLMSSDLTDPAKRERRFAELVHTLKSAPRSMDD